MDNFLTAGFCESISSQFPDFRDAHAINENEEIGGKATREKVRTLGDAFEQLDDLVRHPEFLALVEHITGVPHLHYDPYYFGGGTHENCDGQDLDPHIDFNYHPVTSQHRRLNLIIYLNEGWQEDWGGSLQLHQDPYREPDEDEIVTVNPSINRCVIFETSEHSWHGFERIALPDGKKHFSRKSFAVYYYTDTRPPDETAEEHSTIYVERHLPKRFQAGVTLTSEDTGEIKRLLRRRDQHLQRLYRDNQELLSKLNELRYSGGGTRKSMALPEEVPTDLKSAFRMIQVLRHRVAEMEASTSWRITAPVRAIKRLISGKY
ncbi:MAG: 2OG-Fe(II) oxygenase [Xanthomonadales bacterium]|nr:2OG-Fe(II) oxygenase [Gammaproteobacteria bacterium]MBT8053239.1 2OG-Fe(II) oxygenase [Gammaproteobacteria bacterium]NNK50279.1 2OG-Fe(II) oxygenase [Xanthomonadales bacterium]